MWAFVVSSIYQYMFKSLYFDFCIGITILPFISTFIDPSFFLFLSLLIHRYSSLFVPFFPLSFLSFLLPSLLASYLPSFLPSLIPSFPYSSLSHLSPFSSLFPFLFSIYKIFQDLKDFMRKAGDVVFSDVDSRTMEGVVEFSNRCAI